MDILYPAGWAVERALDVPGVRPTRLFRVLWPLWQVEAAAERWEEQTYDIVDRFVVRGIREGGLRRVGELSEFFGLPGTLVERCLDFLERIGHMERDGDVVRLTDLGVRSATAGVRLARTEDRLRLLVDRFTHRPLPREHYDPSVAVLAAPSDVVERWGFRALFSAEPFRVGFVDELANRPDRAAYNLPLGLENPRVVSVSDGYLPAHLVEIAGGDLLAFTKVSSGRDAFLESVCRQAAGVRNLLDEPAGASPREIWIEWAADEQRHGLAEIAQLESGLWRATFGADVFGEGPMKLGLTRLGSFDVFRDHFIQLWCDDEELRRRALLDRAVPSVNYRARTATELLEQVAALAHRLEVLPPGLGEIRHRAESLGETERAATLVAWQAELEVVACDDG
jgi:hypothetical protein